MNNENYYFLILKYRITKHDEFVRGLIWNKQYINLITSGKKKLFIVDLFY